MIIFDIETGPRPREEIAHLEPIFEAPSNWKDEAKIAENLEKQRATWYQKAALSAITGKVLAIGMLQETIDGDVYRIYADENEAITIQAFWDAISSNGYMHHAILGFNSNSFDLPFLVRRSWLLGVTPPADLFGGRFLCGDCKDILDYWNLGERGADRVSLNTVAKYLGVGEKTGSGADFAALFSEDQEAAINYLKTDLKLTYEVAKKLGLVKPTVRTDKNFY